MSPTIRFCCLFVFLVFASGCTYREGALLETPDTKTRAARQRGCVDIAATIVADARVAKPGVVVRYDFGNRCEHGERLDLTAATVTLHTDDQREVKLVLQDPAGHVHADLLEARTDGHETLQYDLLAGTTRPEWDQAQPKRVCIDLGPVADRAISNVVCLDAAGEPSPGPVPPPSASEHADFGSTWHVVPFVPLRLEVGVTGHSVGTSDMRLASSALGSAPAEILGRRVGAATLDLRVSGFVTERLYVGGELSAGGGPATSGVFVANDRVVQTTAANYQILTGAIAGVTTGRLGPLEGRVEIFGGGRVLIAHPDGDACKDSGCKPLFGGEAVLMPRLGADFWVAPVASIGPWGGFDLLHQGDVSGGIVLTLHGRAYDGHPGPAAGGPSSRSDQD